MTPAAQFVEIYPGVIVPTASVLRVDLDGVSIRYWIEGGGGEDEYGFGNGGEQSARLWYEAVRLALGAYTGNLPI